MFEEKRTTTLYPIILAAACFASGYALATYRASNAAVQLTTSEQGQLLLSYKKSQPRQLQLTQGVATLGTVRERLDDLLLEDPQTIRRYTREAITK